jgi:hypothetical protein
VLTTGMATRVPHRVLQSISWNRRWMRGMPFNSLPCTAAVMPTTGPVNAPQATCV